MKVDYLQFTNTKQLTDSIIMVRPANFGYNEETAENNVFQSDEGKQSKEEIKKLAIAEFDDFVRKLNDHDIDVLVLEDTASPVKTDAVFPNNWISLHENGVLITYPMFSPNRRLERRTDLIELIESKYRVNKHYSFDFYEDSDMFLEGTGSMIFDRVNKIVYSSLSIRTEPRLLEKFSVLMNYRKVVFHATDADGTPIYHTNVLMALGIDFVIICLDCIRAEEERKDVIKSFERTGKAIIEISEAQMNAFAGNMLQVLSRDGKPYLVMSEQAFKSLDGGQMEQIRSYTDILYVPITNIEKYGGGSARCMIAENFLSPLPEN